MNKIKRLTTAVVLLIMAVSATAAAGADMIRIADPSGDYGYPTPHGHYSRGSGYVQMSLIFDTLVWKDADGFVPALADSWSYDEGENAYTFSLNRDAKWTDGTDFTAEDVRFTISYFKENPYLWADLASVETCEVVDPDTAKIILKEPYTPFITEIAGSMPILPKHVWNEVEDPANFVDERALIGTGPYMLENYSKEHFSYLYRANHEYYRGEPKFEKVVFIKATDGQVALMNGDADMAPVKPEAIETLEQNGFTAVYGSCFWNHKLMINHHKEPFNRTEFRQALAYGINRTELVEKAGRGYGSEASLGFLPPESDWYTDDQPAYDHNPEKARELIESLGYQLVDGVYEKDGEKLQVELSIIAKETKLAEILKMQLTEIGIPTIVSALELTTLDSKVKNWNFDIALSRHGLLKADPKTLINLLHGNTSWSARYFENEELNDKLEEQLHEMDKGKRTEIVHKIQKLCAEDLPAIALYYPDYYYAASDKTEWYFTKEGIANGLRLPLNKLSLIRDSSEPASADCIIAGDANDDCRITTTDTVIALQMAAGSIAPDQERVDVNSDGTISSLDALMILNMAQMTQVSVDAPKIVSDTFDVKIEIYSATDLDSGQFDLTFDPAVVNVTDVNSGEIGGTTIPIDSWNFTDAGTIRVLLNLPAGTVVSGDGQIATISFEIVGTAGDTSVLELSRGSLVDGGSNETPALWFGCEVTIGVPVAVNAPEVITDAFTATVDVEDISNMNSGQFDLTFDPGVVNVTAVNAGDISGTTVPIADWRFMDTGTIRVLFKLSSASGVSGTGSVATIEFAVSGSQDDTSVLDISKGLLSDTGADEIPVVWIDDRVTV